MVTVRMSTSSQRYLILLFAISLLATMLMISNYTVDMYMVNSQPAGGIIISEADRRVLLRYFERYVNDERLSYQTNAYSDDKNNDNHITNNNDDNSDSRNNNNNLKDNNNQDKITLNQVFKVGRPLTSAGFAPLPAESRVMEVSINYTVDESTVPSVTQNDYASKKLTSNNNLDSQSNELDASSIMINGTKQYIDQPKEVKGNSDNSLSDKTSVSVDMQERRENFIKAGRHLSIPPTFTRDELSIVSKLSIDKPGFCDDDLGASRDLLVIVISAVKNFKARDAIRRTWGQFIVERGSLLLFLIGKAKENENEIQQNVLMEDKINGDILQGEFIDHYYNLTLKTLSMINWVNSNCDKVKYVLKVDDDMFVNVQLLNDFAETRTYKKVIIGKVAKHWLPHREANSKWFMPQSVFNGTSYPNFATGPAYLIAGDAISHLLNATTQMTPVRLEDVYLTGIVAEKAGVRRLHYSLFKNVYVKVTKCNFPYFMTSHKHTPEEIIRLWNVVYSNTTVQCTTIKQQQQQQLLLAKRRQLVLKQQALKKQLLAKQIRQRQMIQASIAKQRQQKRLQQHQQQLKHSSNESPLKSNKP